MNIENIKKCAAESAFFQTFNLIKKQPKLIFYTLIFDFLFFSGLYGLDALLRLIMPGYPIIADLSKVSASLLLSLIVVYPLSIILSYSFFKWIVLDFAKSFAKETEFSFSRFWSFCFFNLLILAAGFMSLVIVGAVLGIFIKKEILSFIVAPIFMVILICGYILINISHSLFIEGLDIKKIFHVIPDIIFKRIKDYLPVLLFSAVYLAVYFCFFWLITRPFKTVALEHGYAYMVIFTVITYIVLYIILVFNRVYFYLITQERFI